MLHLPWLQLQPWPSPWPSSMNTALPESVSPNLTSPDRWKLRLFLSGFWMATIRRFWIGWWRSPGWSHAKNIQPWSVDGPLVNPWSLHDHRTQESGDPIRCSWKSNWRPVRSALHSLNASSLNIVSSKGKSEVPNDQRLYLNTVRSFLKYFGFQNLITFPFARMPPFLQSFVVSKVSPLYIIRDLPSDFVFCLSLL